MTVFENLLTLLGEPAYRRLIDVGTEALVANDVVNDAPGAINEVLAEEPDLGELMVIAAGLSLEINRLKDDPESKAALVYALGQVTYMLKAQAEDVVGLVFPSEN